MIMNAWKWLSTDLKKIVAKVYQVWIYINHSRLQCHKIYKPICFILDVQNYCWLYKSFEDVQSEGINQGKADFTINTTADSQSLDGAFCGPTGPWIPEGLQWWIFLGRRTLMNSQKIDVYVVNFTNLKFFRSMRRTDVDL